MGRKSLKNSANHIVKPEKTGRKDKPTDLDSPPAKRTKNFDDYEVEYILHRIAFNRKLHFLVKWKNYPYEECTFVEDKHVSAGDLYAQYLDSLDYKWEDVGSDKLLEIDGYFEWEDESYVFGVFEGAPQPILILTQEAKEKFSLARNYLAEKNKKHLKTSMSSQI